MKMYKNLIVPGFANCPMTVDVFYPTAAAKAIVVYAHGFNGFKDWGNFDLIASQFANQGFVFVKFNFSHNGTTPLHPEEFVDLEAYGNNNYTKELDDLGNVLNWISSADNALFKEMGSPDVYLIGHSMGGGIVMLKAAEDARIKKVATWAAISECKTPWTNWPANRIENWKQSGVEYSLNSRTKQNLPLYYQLYEDFQHNHERLNIAAAIRSLKIPVLLCHGTFDEAVPVEKAKELQSWQPLAELFVVPSDHVFGRKHPWQADDLPEPMQAVVNKTISFFGNT
ncbi:alpha/beta fold hydrolase [Segetibacter sp. 3557_3]|uniref:alpha/beta hydrolase family protein n=1 Tax=Segetibacter sp. 3557_3 TaxID=2547429 RepID=UPI001058FB3D|nr:alpha/beta fold hydrolase [Segetibacter sp. 3557_3]TDH28907.1 alpha/beta fold hydrolase [Segetibacter sp. 3557_3]